MTQDTSVTTVIDLIRHGEPEGGPMFRGSQDDPLSDLGWQQMRAAIAPQDTWDAIVSSPLLRCQRFAETLAQDHGLPLHVEPRLREIHFGEWEGQTTEAVIAAYGDALSRFWDNPERYPPPGGEPVAEFYDRVREAWWHWQKTLAGQRVLMVCHGGVIRMVLAEVLSIPLGRAFSRIAVPFACRSRIRIDQSDHGTLSCLQSHGQADA